jgi:hypothetical protein
MFAVSPVYTTCAETARNLEFQPIVSDNPMRTTQRSDDLLFWEENLERFACLRGNGSSWQRNFGRERRLMSVLKLKRRRPDIARSGEKAADCAVIASAIYKHVTTPTAARVRDRERLKAGVRKKKTASVM